MRGVLAGWVCAVFVAGFFASALAPPADAQGARWKRRSQPGTGMKASDIEIQDAAIQSALNHLPNQGEERWENPETGNSGVIRPVASYMDGELKCRNFELEVKTVTERKRLFKACREPDGTWKLH